MPVESGYNASTPTGFGLFGVLYRAFNTGTGTGTIIGVSRGGLSFNPNKTFRNPEYDGKHANIKGLDRVVFQNPQITGTILQVTNTNLLEVFEAGGATPSTIQAAGDFFASGDYLANIAVAFKRSDGSWFGYNLPDALCVTYEVAGQGSEGEVEVAVTFEGRLEHGATPDESAAPYQTFEIAA